MRTTEVDAMPPIEKSLLQRRDRDGFGLKVGEGPT